MNAPTKRYFKNIWQAIDGDDLSEVHRHLANPATRATLNEQHHDLTVLHLAAMHGNLDMCKALLSAGADPFVIGRDERSPLATAIATRWWGDEQQRKHRLFADAFVAHVRANDPNGRVAQDASLAKALAERAAADAAAAAKPASPAIDRFVQAAFAGNLRAMKDVLPHVNPDAPGRLDSLSGGEPALHCASRMKHTECVLWLLDEAKCDPNALCAYGTTALFELGHRANIEMLKLLGPRMGAGINLRIADTAKSSDKGKTALRVIAREYIDRGFEAHARFIAALAPMMDPATVDEDFVAAMGGRAHREAEVLAPFASDAAVGEAFARALAKNPNSPARQKMPVAFARYEQWALAKASGESSAAVCGIGRATPGPVKRPRL